MTKDEQIAGLEKEVQQLQGQVGQLSTSLLAALSKIKQLEQRLGKNSRNSDRPPSSDGLSKKPAIPRPRGARKSGGQPGHPGKTLKMREEVDHTIVHPLASQACPCDCDLTSVERQPHWDRRQVFDLPPTILEVVEHQVVCKTCPECRQLHLASFPTGVNSPVQYGERLRALAVLLNVEQGLPLARVQELFAGLTGYDINESTIHSAVERSYDNLEEEQHLIHQAVLNSRTAHADETGERIEGKTQWIHVFSSLLHTLYVVSSKRGGLVINGKESHLANYEGRLIYDCLNSYLTMEGAVTHGLCLAYILRELTALMESEASLTWPAIMHDLLMTYYRFSDFGKGVVEPVLLEQLDRRYAEVLALADREEPPPIKGKRGRPKKSKGRNLMDRLKKWQSATLAFSRHAEMPFTNNLAERDLRPWKTKLKVAGCFRTQQGAERYGRIKGFCSTVKKNGLVVFDQLLAVQRGTSFLRLT